MEFNHVGSPPQLTKGSQDACPTETGYGSILIALKIATHFHRLGWRVSDMDDSWDLRGRYRNAPFLQPTEHLQPTEQQSPRQRQRHARTIDSNPDQGCGYCGSVGSGSFRIGWIQPVESTRSNPGKQLIKAWFMAPVGLVMDPPGWMNDRRLICPPALVKNR